MLFIEFPGAFERQLQRKYNHASLFALSKEDIKSEQVLMERQKDSEELEQFMNSFRSVVERAVGLKPNEQSDVILKLKEELDQHYQHCCSLQGDMTQIKTALKTLIQAIMNAVRSGAGNDLAAQAKLDEEDSARAEHFRLQEFAFISDIMRDNKSIPPAELALTLITEPMNIVTEVLELFQAREIGTLISDLHDQFTSLDDETIKPYQDKITAISNKLTLAADDSLTN
ncbi:MAG: hypothetical protein OEY29_02075 [Gammaproteobacteria bacterium]|nr:hypothetical protein [Gammaproteobacteria bacterium]